MVGEQEKYLLRDLLEVSALANTQNSAVSSTLIKGQDGLPGFTSWPQRTEGNIGSCSLSLPGICSGSSQALSLLEMLLWSSPIMNETLFSNQRSINIFLAVCENAGSWVSPPFVCRSWCPPQPLSSTCTPSSHIIIFCLARFHLSAIFGVTHVNKAGTFYSCKESSFKFC